jgi:hypothetical protein
VRPGREVSKSGEADVTAFLITVERSAKLTEDVRVRQERKSWRARVELVAL